MRLLEVRIENFLILGSGEYSVSNKGLVLISGENKDVIGYDSNGSGKTAAFVEAILWGIYGKTSRGLTADGVVHAKAGLGCSVELEIEDDDGITLYSIRRYRKHRQWKNDVRLYVNDQDVSGVSITDTQNEIDKIIGISFNTFLNSVIFAQGNVRRFTEMTDRERKSVLENVLDLYWLSDLREYTDTKLKEIEKQSLKLNGSILGNRKTLFTLKLEIAKLTALSNTFEEENKKKRKFFRSKIKEVEERLEEIAEKRSKTLISLSRRTIVQEKISHVGEKVKERKAELNILVEEIRDLERQNGALGANLKIARKQYSDTSNALKSPQCVVCGQDIAEEYRHDRICVDREKHEKAKQIYETHQHTLEVKTQLYARSVHDDERLHKLVELLGRLKLKEASYPIKEKQIKEFDQEVLKLRKDLEELNIHLGEIKESTNDFQKAIDETLGNYAILERQLMTELAEFHKLKLQIKNLVFWREGFGPKGIQSLLLDSVVNTLTTKANEYAAILADNSIRIVFSPTSLTGTGQVRDTLLVDVENLSGAEKYPANSAGEKQRINICIALAFSNLVAQRARKRFNFMVFDECFESLDESGVEAVMRLLEKISNKVETVFVISHNTHLQDKFQNEISVVREDGFATVSDL